jgi:predicted ATP-dependent Lon-type protease
MFAIVTSVGPLRRNYAHIRDLSSASQSNSVLMTSFFLLCQYTLSACLRQVYSIFTSFVAQDGKTMLMIASVDGVSKETIQLLLDSGAKASINDRVAHLRFNLELWM